MGVKTAVTLEATLPAVCLGCLSSDEKSATSSDGEADYSGVGFQEYPSPAQQASGGEVRPPLSLGSAVMANLIPSPEVSGREMRKMKRPRPCLLDYSSLPEYLRDNEYIHKHYRADWSVVQTLWSVFGIHNETGNIWTHLVGFIFFLIITVYTARRIPPAVAAPLPGLNTQCVQENLSAHLTTSLLQQSLTSQLPPFLNPTSLHHNMSHEGVSVNSSEISSSGSNMSQETGDMPRRMAVAAVLSELPSTSKRDANLLDLKGIQDALETYFAGMLQQMPHAPSMQEVEAATAPYVQAFTEAFSKLSIVHGVTEASISAITQKLLHSELFNSLQGIEVAGLQDAFQAFVGHYTCLVDSLLHPAQASAEQGDNGSSPNGTQVCKLLGSDQAADTVFAGKSDDKVVHDLLQSGELSGNTCPVPVLRNKPAIRWPLFVFLAGAMVCLLMSASCHLFHCISCKVSRTVRRLDYAGIATFIATSFFPPVYYGFLCQPILRTVYLSAVLVMGAAAVSVSLLPSFQHPKYRPLRAAFFFGMGVSGIIPCTHKFLFYFDEPMVVTTTLLELLMGSLYGLGAFFYASRIPERWLPGRFDIAGHSHQIFHLLVIAGAYTHYQTGLLYLKWRDLHGCSM